MKRYLIGISGASGAVYAKRVLSLLAASDDVEIHLVLTPYGRRLLHDELGMEGVDLDALTDGRGDRVILHRDKDVGATVASGSFQHQGMLIVPCSSNTLGSIAAGVTQNLLHRAALVTIKERRKLVIAHREMPLSSIDIENMDRLTRAGAMIAPLSPGFYMLPRTIDDLVDFVAGRLLDLLGVGHELPVRWGDGEPLRG